ncbi:MAG: rod shape-determining protein RodA [Spirochaetaceae bacterium]|nr:rod shape-determining protein RodA [Spirochaetaceae bacterium]
MKWHFLNFFDYFLLFSVLILVTIGILFIYSSGINSSGDLVSNEYSKQIVFAVAGLVIMILMSFFDYRKLNQWSLFLYIGINLVLIYTRIAGTKVNGARSWLGIGDFGVQPSEFGKIIFILYLARYLDTSTKLPELKRFIYAILIMCIPVGLILIQPDLGTASVYIPIFILMCYMAGIPRRYLTLILSTGLLIIIFSVMPVWESQIYQKSIPLFRVFSNLKLRLLVIVAFALICLIGVTGWKLFKQRYYYWIAFVFGIFTFALTASIAAMKVLKSYQIMRLIVFLNPNVDPQGAGWNIIQSKVAIGSGGLFGQGFLKGTQSHYRFLPQQSTDFIFSILSEEWGFAGCLGVFLLFGVILLRGIMIVKNTKNSYSCYVSSGIVCMIFFHFVVNIGMVMGIMPITGIPLMFLSYGGSSLWTAMAAIGILMSINYRRMDFS